MSVISRPFGTSETASGSSSANGQPSRLSVVVPVYNERETLPELRTRLSEALSRLDVDDCEVLLVSDGSTDGSNALIARMVESDARYRGIFLSRNFGHQAAVSIGLSHAEGTLVAIMDGDLQDPPEELGRLIQAIRDGADVAYAVRTRRKEGILKRLACKAFYRLLRRAASIDIPLDAGDFCCMTRAVVDDMLSLPERNRFVRGLRAWVGYEQVAVPYERAARHAGKTKYSLRKLLGLAYDGIFSFSNLVVRLAQAVGLAVSLTAFLAAALYITLYFAAPGWFEAAPGFTAVAISVWFIGGVQLLFLGLVGEYVYRTFDECRGRPVAVVRQVLRHERRSAPSYSYAAAASTAAAGRPDASRWPVPEAA